MGILIMSGDEVVCELDDDPSEQVTQLALEEWIMRAIRSYLERNVDV